MATNLNIEPISKWESYKNRPLIISGPCSAETEEQLMKTANELAESGKVNVFRAGIWKPRTRPGGFEGVGSIGLKWMKRIKQETGLNTATEVANVKHVYEVLKHGIDYIWIGARTTANPFAVQEIADALEGTDITVMVKNPTSPDIELWIGAIERIRKAGITKIAAIHRGFAYYEKTQYRNLPQWQIPIELKRRINDLPIICDPSHISGDASLLYDISQKAMDLNFEGLMIESHISPETALSDANQQITPNELKELLSRLILRAPISENSNFLDILGELRSNIDILDDQILEILGQRMNISRTIGKYKKENNIVILQNKRWEQIIRTNIEKGEKKGLSSDFISNLFKAIHQESINHQTKIMNE